MDIDCRTDPPGDKGRKRKRLTVFHSNRNGLAKHFDTYRHSHVRSFFLDQQDELGVALDIFNLVDCVAGYGQERV